jgi:hypothetical protein
VVKPLNRLPWYSSKPPFTSFAGESATNCAASAFGDKQRILHQQAFGEILVAARMEPP